mgnify:CR=1 FL=1
MSKENIIKYLEDKAKSMKDNSKKNVVLSKLEALKNNKTVLKK